MASIRFNQVEKRFGSTVVAEGIDLTVDDGEFFTFLGPSGCGKSTLLNLVAGIEPPTAGSIEFDGHPVNHLPAQARDVAMVFQSYALYPHMTVRENLAFPLKNRRRPKKEIENKVQRVAHSLGLTGLLRYKPAQLSGGQRQRVALGRALVRHPAAFLMDEPLSNLDARLRLEMREELKRLHAEHGVTTLYVTHDQEEAMVLSNRMAVLSGGRIQQVGTPQEIYQNPANLFVASFVGTPPINTFPAELAVELEALGSLLRGRTYDRVVAVRPGDISVRAEPKDGAIAARVLVVEPTGPQTWVLGEWRGQRIKGRAEDGARLAAGESAYFVVPPERVYLFLRDSGKAVRA